MRLSVIVVDHHGGAMLARCLAHLRAALEPVAGSELIVVDNGAGHNAGFAGGVVAGMARARGEWIAVVNNDAFLAPDCLTRLLAAAAPGVGSIAPQITFEAHPDVVNSAGLEIDALGVATDRHAGRPACDGPPEEVFGATGCVALYRRAMLDAIGGFDATFFAYQEDADVAWRARMAGWRAVCVPAARATHRGSATIDTRLKYRLVGRNRVRLLAKNATTRHLLRHGAAMVLYDLAYVAYVGAAERTLAPLHGRLDGLREWRAYRRAGAPTRRPMLLDPPSPGRALGMRRAYASRLA